MKGWSQALYSPVMGWFPLSVCGAIEWCCASAFVVELNWLEPWPVDNFGSLRAGCSKQHDFSWPLTLLGDSLQSFLGCWWVLTKKLGANMNEKLFFCPEKSLGKVLFILWSCIVTVFREWDLQCSGVRMLQKCILSVKLNVWVLKGSQSSRSEQL